MLGTQSFKKDKKIHSCKETTHCKRGEVLYARDYTNFNIYLMQGHIKLYSDILVSNIYSGDDVCLKMMPIFNNDKGYMECAEDCEFVIVHKLKDKSVLTLSESLNQGGKTNDENQHNKNEVSEVSNDLLGNIAYKKTALLLGHIKVLHKRNISSLARLLKKTKNKKAVKNKHVWLRMCEAYPIKSGMYYVTDGEEIRLVYFNREKLVFNIDINFNIVFWSTKSICQLQ